MPLVTWDNSIAVDIKSIDTQHQRWISLINDMHDAMLEGKGRDTVAKTLAAVVDYTQTHFSYEEGLMVKFGYAEYAAHKAMHDELTAKVLDWQRRQRAGDITLTLALMDTLKTWLIQHIQTTDRRYAATFKSKGVL